MSPENHYIYGNRTFCTFADHICSEDFPTSIHRLIHISGKIAEIFTFLHAESVFMLGLGQQFKTTPTTFNLDFHHKIPIALTRRDQRGVQDCALSYMGGFYEVYGRVDGRNRL